MSAILNLVVFPSISIWSWLTTKGYLNTCTNTTSYLHSTYHWWCNLYCHPTGNQYQNLILKSTCHIYSADFNCPKSDSQTLRLNLHLSSLLGNAFKIKFYRSKGYRTEEENLNCDGVEIDTLVGTMRTSEAEISWTEEENWAFTPQTGKSLDVGCPWGGA